MNDVYKDILSIDIEEELKKSYLDYAMSVIIGRALPDVRDGLKPVHRRILFAMYMLNNFYDKSYKKSARIVGDVIGKYHPHGDTAVYDAIVRMAQSFSLRYVLIDGQGNFGSIDGDPPAAMRYTEIKMSKIAYDLLVDLDKNTVDYVSNYDGVYKIPSIMPTRIPNLLINGSSGIAVGLATNIPPHNLSEVINGCIAYLNNEDITVRELMRYIPGPDFPTFSIINGKSGIESAYLTGKGKIYIRGQAEVKLNNKTGREVIVIYDIPYQVNKSRLVEKIAELSKKKRIEGISNLRDESDKDGLRIVIDIKKDFCGDIVLNNLYLSTQLQVSFGINMVALCNGRPKVMSLKDILSSFIAHRKEVVIRRTVFELRKFYYRSKQLEAFGIALVNIDLVIDMINKSVTTEEAMNKLLNYSWDLDLILVNEKNKVYLKFLNLIFKTSKNNIYIFNKDQACSILNLRLQTLVGLKYKELFNEYNDLLIKIVNLENILHNCEFLIDVIRKELIEIKDKYNDCRRTKIMDKSVVGIKDLINEEKVVVTLSHQGYIKYQPLSDYRTQHRGSKGKSAARIKDKDFIAHMLVGNTHDILLLFSIFGKMYKMKIYQLPEFSRGSRGKFIGNLLPLEDKESITAIFSINDFLSGQYIFMVTLLGIVKKISIDEVCRSRGSGVFVIKLSDNDKLVGVNVTNGYDEIMLFTAFGKVVKFLENQVRVMSRNSFGVKGIKLLSYDYVVSLIIPRGGYPILTVTKCGYGNRTSCCEYPLRSRFTQGVISIKVDKRNGNVISAVQVSDDDHVMIITDSGNLIRTKVSEINVVSRNSKGVILIRISKNDSVVGLQRIVVS